MIRPTALAALLALAACNSATPIAHLGVSLSPNGVNVSPGVGLSTGNATLVFHP